MPKRTMMLPCAAPGPYPPVRAEEADPTLAGVLHDPYAGKLSELTASKIYLYAKMTLERQAPRLAKMFECIAVNEMQHMEILAEAIQALGGDPKYVDSRGREWDTDSVVYTDSPQEALKVAARGEREVIGMYERLIDRVEDRCLQEVLRRIKADHERHLAIIRSAMDEYRVKEVN